MPTSLSPARAANEAAEFLPANPDDDGTLPCLRVAGAFVFAYVTDDGVLQVSVHVDAGDIPSWLLQPDGTAAVHIAVDRQSVSTQVAVDVGTGIRLAASPYHHRSRTEDRDATFEGDPAAAVTAGVLAADLSRHDPRRPVWVQDTLLPTRLVPLRPGVTLGTGPTAAVGCQVPVVVLGVVEDRR
jgi:hypothetical protein